MTAFDVLVRTIDELPGDVFRVFTSGKEPATEAELAALEQRIGRPLPVELRALLLQWGVLVIEVVESVWPRPREFDVGPAWQMSYGVRVLGCGVKVPAELTIADAVSPELTALGAVPVLRRIGARWLGVAIADGVGTWAPGDPEVERAEGNVIDLILAEIHALQEGVTKLTTKAAGTDELLAKGRALGWKGFEIGEVVDTLKLRPADEIGPHLTELVEAMLDAGTFSMGVLGIIAAAGPAYFAPVADRVYAQFSRSIAPYVIQLLGKVGDVSSGALALYRGGLVSKKDDVFSETVKALLALSAQPAIRSLLPDIEAIENPKREPVVIGLLGHLGSDQFERRARAAIAADDPGFGALVQALRRLPAVAAPLGPELLARLRTMAPDKPAAFNTIEVLCALGIEDRAHMEPIVRSFVSRGGGWTKRAEALLARWS